MKEFGGPVLFLDRNDINTDEIIPAKYLTENTKMALQPFMLEDLKLGGFDPCSATARQARVIVTRANFGCGSSREHAVWVFEVNKINVVIGESFARIFRQNMFNCGMLAIELPKIAIQKIFDFGGDREMSVRVLMREMVLHFSVGGKTMEVPFELNSLDEELIMAGGWLAYADKKY